MKTKFVWKEPAHLINRALWSYYLPRGSGKVTFSWKWLK